MDNTTQCISALDGISEQIAALQRGDQAAVIAIGVRLEEASNAMGAADGPRRQLLNKMLLALQAAYQDQLANHQAAVGEMARAALVLLEDVQGEASAPERLVHACLSLRTAMEAAPQQGATAEAHPCEPLTLDEAAALLAALEPESRDQIRRIAHAVKAYQEPGPHGEEVQTLANSAAQSLAQAMQAQGDQARQALCAAAETIAQMSARLEQLGDAQNTDAQPAHETSAKAGSSVSASQAQAPAIAAAAAEPQSPAAICGDEGKPNRESMAQAAPEQPARATLPNDADMELLKEYVVESLDHIGLAENALLALETNPDQPEPINTVFRAFHTIKGTSGFLGLDMIQRVAHLAENLLERARSGQVRLTGGYADLSLRSCDALKYMIEALKGAQPGEALALPEHVDDLIEKLKDPEAAGISDEAIREDLRLGDILVARGADREVVETAAGSQGKRPLGEVLLDSNAASAEQVAQALRTQKQMNAAGAADATIRVGTDRLDNLINMVGELVIAQSMVAQDPDVLAVGRPRLARSVSHAGKIVRELQDLTMSLRMVPLKQTFQKMARLVRDLGRKSGKQVQFVSEGEDTEIDRNMVEVLNDPLVHMIRNAADHGIEPAEVRRQQGKSPTGTVTLRAYHAAGSVVIELCDDGKGLDRQRIIAKAIERKLIAPGADLTEGEAFALIFQPGFSTAEKITDVSGRGVGMDVVKRGIEKLRGRIEISSRPGEGSVFTLRLPLTMAITDAMMLRVGRQRFLLPTISIEQSFRPTPGCVSTIAGRGEMVMLRGRLLPLFPLHRLYNVPDAQTNPYQGLLVVVEGGGKRCALMVDELLGQQQVVIKSLGKTFANVPGVSGGAILGDGRVGLILDAVGIINLADGQTQTLESMAAA